MKRLSSGVGILLVVFIAIVGISGGIVGKYISAKNMGVEYTSDIKAADKDSQQILSSYTLKIRDMAQVPKMYTKDLKSIIQSTFQGRYGENGSKANMQWIKEHSQSFDSSLYRNLMATMESGRNEFKLSQTRKIDMCRLFERNINYAVQGIFMNLAGYHTLPVECRVITDSETDKTFKSGKATSIKL